MFEELIKNLQKALSDSLPGKGAHLLLAPEIRKGEILMGKIPSSAQEGAVLILLYKKKSSIHTVVILRNEYDGIHSGQISLPGGKKEVEDTDFIATALRETYEEIGIPKDSVQIIGELSTFYVIPSNFVIHPFIGVLSKPPAFIPDASEVQRIIEIDVLNDLIYDKVTYRELFFRNSMTITAPGFNVDNEFMWGATAMIYSELISILERIPKSNS